MMMGMRMPETCSAVFKRPVIKLRSCCIWVVDSVESMMMHGIANPKYLNLFCNIRFSWYTLQVLHVKILRYGRRLCVFLLFLKTNSDYSLLQP